MSFIRASGLGPLTASNTATIVDPGVTSGANFAPIVSMTPVSMSGTTVSFTDIPSWVKRVTIMYGNLSTNGTSGLLAQLGTASGYVTTGYSSGAWTMNTSNATNTSGFLGSGGTWAATTFVHGTYNLYLLNASTNYWICNMVSYGPTGGYGGIAAGDVTLSGVLTRVRLTTVNGTDAFDAGTMNVMYE